MKTVARVVGLILALVVAACGGVQSSSQGAAFNASLDRCANTGGESQQREACMRRVMHRYGP